MPIIQALRRLRQKDQELEAILGYREFQISLRYLARHSFKTHTHTQRKKYLNTVKYM
jgi:hypothetical protein